MEETDFCDPVEERVMGKIAEKGAKLQINPKATPVTESRKVIEQKRQENQVYEAYDRSQRL